MRTVLIAVLVLALVALAIYLALRPSDAAAQAALAASGGTSTTGARISSIGSSATSLIASVADAAG